MRVGFDARWYNSSGVGTYVRGLLEAYSQIEDPEIEVIAFEDPHNRLPVPSAGILRKVDLAVHRYSVSEQIELPLVCRKYRLQLFHSPFYVVPRFCSCPIVATLFDLAPFHFALYGPLKTLIVKRGYRVAARTATRIVTCSGHSELDISRTLRVPRQKISSIPLAADRNSFWPTECSDDLEALNRLGVQKPYVLLLGARNWRTKNLDAGLKAVRRAREVSELRFETVLAGNTDALSDPSVNRVAALLDVKATGPISARELAALYRNAELFLFPSRFEGFGIPVLEAMSSGCPVVCSNAASLKEVAGDGALTVDPDDIEGMAGGIVALMEAATRQFWKARALRRASNFSFARTAIETLGVYREVLARSSRSGDVSPQGRQWQEVR